MNEFLVVYNKHDIIMEKELYLKGVEKGYIKKRQPYNNVFNSIYDNSSLLNKLGYKVAFAYLEVNKGKYIRTAVLVRKGQIVDTNRHFYVKQEDSKYYVMKEYDIREYISKFLENEGDLLFRKELYDLDKKWQYYFYKQGYKVLK